MTVERRTVASAIVAAIGGVLGGLALGYVGWVGTLSSMSLPAELTLENSLVNGIGMIGALLIAAAVTIPSFVVGSVLGSYALPALLIVDRPHGRFPYLLLLDVLVVPASIGLAFLIEGWSPPTWVVLGLPAILVGGAVPAASWWVASRFSAADSPEERPIGASRDIDL